MDLIKAATEWAKAEVFSSVFFIVFGTTFVLATLGFWQLGKTEIAKAFIFPTLVAGIFLLTVGLGLFFLNKSRITSFPETYQQDAPAFVASELDRTEQSIQEYQLIVFKVIPLLIVAAALLLLFVNTPIWRAISATALAMFVVIVMVDSNAHARLKDYHAQLELVDKPTELP